MNLHTVTNTLNYCYQNKPDTHATPIQTLDYLLFRTGNQCQWENGQLKHPHLKAEYPTRPNQTYREAKIARAYRSYQRELTNPKRTGSVDKHLRNARQAHIKEIGVKEWHTRCEARFERKVKAIKAAPDEELEPSLYPVNPNSKINKIPKDIQEDWLAAVLELMTYALKKEHYVTVLYPIYAELKAIHGNHHQDKFTLTHREEQKVKLHAGLNLPNKTQTTNVLLD